MSKNEKCPQCNGTGKEELFDCKCRRCNGSGESDKKDLIKSDCEKQTCPQCNGHGKEELTNNQCRRCKGAKTVDAVVKEASFLSQPLTKIAQTSPETEDELENPFAGMFDDEEPVQKPDNNPEKDIDDAILNVNNMSGQELKFGIISMLRMLNKSEITNMFNQVCNMFGEDPSEILASKKSETKHLYESLERMNLQQLTSVFCLSKRYI